MAVRKKRLDDAARAGWLYFVAGHSQDEIAAAMGISRQSVQRLVSAAQSEHLVKMRLDHPIAACLALAKELKSKFNLKHAEVVPSDPFFSSPTVGVAEAGAAEIERWLKSKRPIVMAVGTGATMKAAVDQLPHIDCPKHRVVSLAGNIAPDGSAAYSNVIFSMANSVNVRHYPMPIAVTVSSARERKLLHKQELVRLSLSLSAIADVAFVGIGELGNKAPLAEKGFVDHQEVRRLMKAGAVGEICGWMYDEEGKLLEDPFNDRVGSCPIPRRDKATVIGMAQGKRKYEAIAAALKGCLINGLITDEATAKYLLTV